MNSPKKIIMLAGDGSSTVYLYNYITQFFNIAKIIIEAPVPKKQFLKKRVKRYGILKTLGQIFFQLMCVPVLKKTSKQRLVNIKKLYALNEHKIDDAKIFRVKSINSSLLIDYLKQQQPDIIIVNGTRIISKAVLEATPAIFINMHAGITPRYRGVHGAYWALFENQPNLCGVTIHLVDTGIDTGKVLYQKSICITSQDNFVTYPLLQLAEGLPLLKKAIIDIMEDQLHIANPLEHTSKLWSHPTIFGYLYYWIFKGIK